MRAMRSKIAVALAVLVMGFLVVTNPVVVNAAKLVTGSQVKDNSLTGKDVKESTLKGVNATTLSGKPGKDFLNPTYRYRLPVQPAAIFHTYELPGLPKGTYLATFNGVFAVAAPGKAVLCRLEVDGSKEMVSYGAPAQFNNFSTAAASAVVTVTATPNLFCNSQSAPPDAWSVFDAADTPSVVTFTRVGNTKSRTPTPSRTRDRRALVTQ